MIEVCERPSWDFRPFKPVTSHGEKLVLFKQYYCGAILRMICDQQTLFPCLKRLPFIFKILTTLACLVCEFLHWFPCLLHTLIRCWHCATLFYLTQFPWSIYLVCWWDHLIEGSKSITITTAAAAATTNTDKHAKFINNMHNTITQENQIKMQQNYTNSNQIAATPYEKTTHNNFHLIYCIVSKWGGHDELVNDE